MEYSERSEKIRHLIKTSKKPLVFRGLIDSWPMLSYSTTDWEKLFNGKSLDCRVGHINQSDSEPQWEGRSGTISCTYSQLADWAKFRGELRMNLGDDSLPLSPSSHFIYFAYQYMKDLFDQEEILSQTDWKELGQPGRNGKDSTFWLGTAGAHTPCHYDTYGCNLVAQISGKKRWILYPPEDGEFLEPTRVPYEESSVYSRINLEEFGKEGVPPIKGTHPHVVVLLPGDVLFVPRHWWHHVTNLELSVSVNTWLEMPEEDEDARLEEGLVKFFMAHVSRNLEPDVVIDLMNPNELETVEADLEEIHGFIRHSIMQLKEKSNNSKENQVIDDHLISPEPWIIPVTCVGHQKANNDEERNDSNVNRSTFDVLDVVRAFCHPDVIKTVSSILRK